MDFYLSGFNDMRRWKFLGERDEVNVFALLFVGLMTRLCVSDMTHNWFRYMDELSGAIYK